MKIALQIFEDRLPLIKTDVRAQSASAIEDIAREAAMSLSKSSALRPSALSGIRAIASSALRSEDAALAQIIPILVTSLAHPSNSGIMIDTLSLIELLMSVLLNCLYTIADQDPVDT